MDPHSEPSPEELKPFVYRVALAAGIVIVLLLFVVVLWFAVDALLLAFAGAMLAILLRAPADWLAQRTRLSEGWALALVIVALLALLVGLGFWLVPQIREQGRELQQQLPEVLEGLQEGLQQYPGGEWLLGAVGFGEDAQQNGQAMDMWEALGMAYTAIQAFFGIFILLFVVLYLSINPVLYTNGLLHLFPFRQRQRVAEVLGAMSFTLRWWLAGTLVRMLLVGLMTFVGLGLLGVPLTFLLAAIAFLLNFVPYFGPVVAALPAVMLAFVEGPEVAMYVVLLYVVVQQIDSLVLSPLVYQKTVYLPPVLTILGQIVLFAMAGALGVILATPLTAVALVLVKMLYVQQTLGDHHIDRPEDAMGPHDMPPVPD